MEIIAAVALVAFGLWILRAGMRDQRFDASDVTWEPSRGGRVVFAEIYDGAATRDPDDPSWRVRIVPAPPFDWAEHEGL